MHSHDSAKRELEQALAEADPPALSPTNVERCISIEGGGPKVGGDESGIKKNISISVEVEDRAMTGERSSMAVDGAVSPKAPKTPRNSVVVPTGHPSGEDARTNVNTIQLDSVSKILGQFQQSSKDSDSASEKTIVPDGVEMRAAQSQSQVPLKVDIEGTDAKMDPASRLSEAQPSLDDVEKRRTKIFVGPGSTSPVQSSPSGKPGFRADSNAIESLADFQANQPARDESASPASSASSGYQGSISEPASTPPTEAQECSPSGRNNRSRTRKGKNLFLPIKQTGPPSFWPGIDHSYSSTGEESDDEDDSPQPWSRKRSTTAAQSRSVWPHDEVEKNTQKDVREACKWLLNRDGIPQKYRQALHSQLLRSDLPEESESGYETEVADEVEEGRRLGVNEILQVWRETTRQTGEMDWKGVVAWADKQKAKEERIDSGVSDTTSPVEWTEAKQFQAEKQAAEVGDKVEKLKLEVARAEKQLDDLITEQEKEKSDILSKLRNLKIDPMIPPTVTCSCSATCHCIYGQGSDDPLVATAFACGSIAPQAGEVEPRLDVGWYDRKRRTPFDDEGEFKRKSFIPEGMEIGENGEEDPLGLPQWNESTAEEVAVEEVERVATEDIVNSTAEDTKESSAGESKMSIAEEISQSLVEGKKIPLAEESKQPPLKENERATNEDKKQDS